MNKFFILFQQSYSQKLKSKTFILTTCLYVILLCGIAFFDDIKALLSKDEVTNVALFNATPSDALNNLQLGNDYKVKQVNDAQAVQDAVSNQDATIGIVLQDEEQLAAEIYSAEPLQLNEQTKLTDHLSTLAINFAYEKIQLTTEQQQIITTAIPKIDMIALNDVSSKTAEQKLAGMIGSYIVGILIYIFVISYLSIITTDVASEKGSRVLEMVLVGIKPETHFNAKVMATMFVAITQFLIVLIAGAIIIYSKANTAIVEQGTDLIKQIDASYVLFVVGFLLFTLLLYLIIGALFGSLVAKVEEASQVMTPAMIVIIVAFYVMVIAFNNPDAVLVKVCSYIPFTAGMVMPMRLGGSDVSLIEPSIALILLITTVFVLYRFSMIYYKRSVLAYSTGGLVQKLKQLFKMTT